MNRQSIIQLGSLLLQECYGQIVADVGCVLMQNGPCPMRFISTQCKQSILNVKKALITLIQHQLVTHETNSVGLTIYKIDINRVINILRYPKFIYSAKMLYDDEGEYVIEELLKNGQLTMSDTIQRVVNRMAVALDENAKKNLPKKVHDVFAKFINTRFVQRTNIQINKDDEDDDLSKYYVVPKVKLNLIKIDSENDNKVKVEEEEEEEEGPPRKKKRTSEGATSGQQADLDIYWTVNTMRFHQFLRDQLIIDGVKNYFDDTKAGEIVRIILRLSETRTHPYSAVTSGVIQDEIIRNAIKENICLDEKEVEKYLLLFHQDDKLRVVFRCEEKTDAAYYSVNIIKMLDKLNDSCLSSIVQDRFGTKSARIFRLLLDKKYLEQKQIEEKSMITAKETKLLTYNLISENVIKLMQCPKTNEYNATRTIYLFHIDKMDLSRDLLQRCYHAVSSAIIRRLHITQENKSLLERKNFIDAVIMNLQMQQDVQDVEQQIQDLKESFSSHDSETLETIYRDINTLENSELHIDETMFLLQIWLFMKHINGNDYEKVEKSLKIEF